MQGGLTSKQIKLQQWNISFFKYSIYLVHINELSLTCTIKKNKLMSQRLMNLVKEILLFWVIDNVDND